MHLPLLRQPGDASVGAVEEYFDVMLEIVRIEILRILERYTLVLTKPEFTGFFEVEGKHVKLTIELVELPPIQRKRVSSKVYRIQEIMRRTDESDSDAVRAELHKGWEVTPFLCMTPLTDERVDFLAEVVVHHFAGERLDDFGVRRRVGPVVARGVHQIGHDVVPSRGVGDAIVRLIGVNHVVGILARRGRGRSLIAAGRHDHREEKEQYADVAHRAYSFPAWRGFDALLRLDTMPRSRVQTVERPGLLADGQKLANCQEIRYAHYTCINITKKAFCQGKQVANGKGQGVKNSNFWLGLEKKDREVIF